MAFDADHPLAEARQVLADRSHAAVRVQNGIALGQLRGLGDRLIELFRRKRIRLEEREWRDYSFPCNPGGSD